MGCGASVDEGPPTTRHEVRSASESDESVKNGSTSSRDGPYRDDAGMSASSSSARSRSSAESGDGHLTQDEVAQLDAIRQRRRSMKRPCSLASDDSMRHYTLVTGNQKEDEYFDSSRIKVRSNSTGGAWMSDDDGSEGGSPLSRKSSMRSSGSFGSPLKKAVSFSKGAPVKWKPCVRR